MRLPDAPPLERAEESRLKQRWVADVVEGYHATYISNHGFLWVSAIRFNDARLATAGPPRVSSEGSRRVVVGATVVRLAGTTGECLKAIDAHIRALK